MTPDMEAKFCKCDFKREELEGPDLSIPFKLAPELIEEIKRLAETDSNSYWANSKHYAKNNQTEIYALER